MYRMCKQFEFQAAHVLSKHPGLCRHPHGHTYRVDVVLRARELDASDMVCDFGAVRVAMDELLAQLDHTVLVNSADEVSMRLFAENPRKTVFAGCDPTTETLARKIFEHLSKALRGGPLIDAKGITYPVGPNVAVERVRVWETSTAWAEYGEG